MTSARDMLPRGRVRGEGERHRGRHRTSEKRACMWHVGSVLFVDDVLEGQLLLGICAE